MIPKHTRADRPGETRRQFIKTTGTVAAAVAGAGLFDLPAMARERSASVAIVLDAAEPVTQDISARWAAEQLRDTLMKRGVIADIFDRLDQVPPAQECILATGSGSSLARQICQGRRVSVPDVAESFALARGPGGGRIVVLAAGADARGLVYALLELADRVQFAADPMTPIQVVPPQCERPVNAVRGVARQFASDVEDKGWFQDREFWTRYLTLLAAQRFNRFHLIFGLGYDVPEDLVDVYFYFAYPFLLSVPGYDVRAVPLPDSERDANLAQIRFISDEAARRGLHFQLGLWTHAYQWTNSPRANYVIEGLTPQTHGPYCRDALRAILTACPNIRGITFRIHGESGVPEGHYDLWQTIFDGVAQCGRTVEVDMHAKGMDEQMMRVGLGTGMPVNISPKFWAEHMGLPYMQGAIRPQEMPPAKAPTTGLFTRSLGARSFLRYGYGDLMAEDRRYAVFHRIWPGTQRLLAWADPDTAAAYGRVASFCGSKGIEWMEPLNFKGRKGSGVPGNRTAYADASLRPADDFEKYAQSYRVWGRSLYNPDGDAAGKQRRLQQQFGHGADALKESLAAAGKILPLITTAHSPSAANNLYWPEMYFNMAIVSTDRPNPYGDTPSPKRFGTVSPLDPEFFLGLDEFADELLTGEASGKYSPAWVAARLDASAEEALARLHHARSRSRDPHGAEFRRLAVDAAIQAGLGKFFAAKFRSGVCHALYLRTGHVEALRQAVADYQAARAAWAGLANTAKGVYVDDVTFGPQYYLRGHWLDRLPAMDADLADMEQLLKTAGPGSPEIPRHVIEQALSAVTAEPLPEAPSPFKAPHVPPSAFQRGQPVTVMARGRSGLTLNLRYRRVNQAESWQTIEMEKVDAVHQAVIATDYTDSPFPLQYYFQVKAGGKRTWLYPGLHPGWQGQPYFIIRQG